MDALVIPAEIQRGFNYALAKTIGMGAANTEHTKTILLLEPDSAFDLTIVQRLIQEKTAFEFTFTPGYLYHGAGDLIHILNSGSTEKDVDLTRIVQDWGSWVFSKEFKNPCVIMLTTDTFEKYHQQGKAQLKFVGSSARYPLPKIALELNDVEEIWVSEDTWGDLQHSDSLNLSEEGKQRLNLLLKEKKIKLIPGLHHRIINEDERVKWRKAGTKVCIGTQPS